MTTCLAVGPALAERCETPPRHWQRFGHLHVGVRHEGSDRLNYVVKVAALYADSVGTVEKLNPTSTPTLVATPPPPSPPATTNDGFKAVGKFDVRLDKVVAEGRFWHVYLTLRNASSATLVQAQGVDVRLEDSEGIGVESGQAVRARPGPPELFGSPPPTTRPGGTLPVKFVFDKREGAAPARIVVMEGEHEAAFRLG